MSPRDQQTAEYWFYNTFWNRKAGLDFYLFNDMKCNKTTIHNCKCKYNAV